LDWGFGRGRSARTGLRLPAYVPPSSVAELLIRPSRLVERHHWAVPEAAAGLARATATPVPGPAGRRFLRSGDARMRAVVAGAAAMLLVAIALAVHRLRRRA
ncbi:MAG TPA: hypothetical protein VK942_17820, partial [Actinomycetes bacterium]|nr:hypothetical protein [Actinomycetes bacterium]